MYLFSGEAYFPSDLQIHLNNVIPEISFKQVPGPSPLTLSNLDQLNGNGTGTNTYLTSTSDVMKFPAYLKGVKPDSTGKSAGKNTPIIVVDHGKGLVDAYYMYFYSYNQGQIVLGKELGDHVGDWYVVYFNICLTS